jgi:hypothetical protein
MKKKKSVWKATTRWAVTPRQLKLAALIRDNHSESENSWEFFEELLSAYCERNWINLSKLEEMIEIPESGKVAV